MDRQNTPLDFRGFDDWVEIFRTGTHTSSNGVTRTWTEDDLDQVVANHSADANAPIVIGHPRVNDPAFGWTAELKRDGNSLLARFTDVNPEFSSSVERGEYRKRSARLYKKSDGTWALDHVGFLGAKRPAIELEGMTYNAREADEVFDFVADWTTPNVLARTLRRIREFFIEQFGTEKADAVLPDYDIEYLSDHATSLREQTMEQTPAPAFAAPDETPASEPADHNAPDGGDTVTPEEHQAAIEAARKEERDKLARQLAEERRKNRAAEFSAFIEQSNLTPAQSEGAVDFMHALADLEEVEFEFSAGDETKKSNPLDWFKAFVAAVPEQVKPGAESFASGDDDDQKTVVNAIGAGMKR